MQPSRQRRRHPSSRIQKNRALEEAKNGVENLVKVAFDVRTRKSRLLVEAQSNTEINDGCAQNEPPLLVLCALADPTEADIRPSIILNNPAKLQLLSKFLNPNDMMIKIKLFDVHSITPLAGDVVLLGKPEVMLLF